MSHFTFPANIYVYYWNGVGMGQPQRIYDKHQSAAHHTVDSQPCHHTVCSQACDGVDHHTVYSQAWHHTVCSQACDGVEHHTVYSQACDGVVAAERDPPPGGSVVAADEARVSVAVHGQTGVV